MPDELHLPLLTIQLALDAEIKTEKPERMAEMVLRHARHVSEAETPLQAQEDAEKRSRALRGIAAKMEKAGMFEEAMEVAKGIGGRR